MFEKISGGVCAPKGFCANGIHCGIRKSRNKRDLSLIFSSSRCSASAVYTKNLVKGAPLIVTKRNIKDGYAQAMIINSGNANTCNSDGIAVAKRMCISVAKKLDIKPTDVIVASTGVIGQKLNVEVIEAGIPKLVEELDESADGSEKASEGIMTTDTIKKEIALKFFLSNGTECHIGGIAKGSGMIHPNMATMLVFITTDISISPDKLSKALKSDIDSSFNMISIDGDTSTNDMVAVIANGKAGNEIIESENEDYEIFRKALNEVNTTLCRLIATDGEGASKFIECIVRGAKNLKIARTVARSIVSSSLFKAAMFGCDANWGRVLCAIGYSGAKVNVKKIDVSFRSTAGEIDVCKNGTGIDFSEIKAKDVLSEKEIEVQVNLNSGEAEARAWGCDLTYDYVKINGDYRT